MYAAVLYLLTGWSGFFVMGIELLGGRLLAPYYGSSIYVWGAIITVFMLALALGYLIGGRFSVRQPSLRRLGLILLLAAVAAVPIPLAADGLLDVLAAHSSDPRFGSLAAALALFFAPTLISGMVSPYAVRLLVAEREQAGEQAGRLYFISTFGSAAGTLLTSFYFVLWFELNQILWGMLGVSLLIAVAACLVRPRATP
jgi:hypothetical protein